MLFNFSFNNFIYSFIHFSISDYFISYLLFFYSSFHVFQMLIASVGREYSKLYTAFYSQLMNVLFERVRHFITYFMDILTRFEQI